MPAIHHSGDRVSETPAEYVIARPTVYLDTTIPSLLTAWRSRDAEIARRQDVTRAIDEPNLDAYNEDARRRALAIGFPAETFVVTAEEVKETADSIARRKAERDLQWRRMEKLRAAGLNRS